MSLSDYMTLSLLVSEFETTSPETSPMSVSQSASNEFSTTISKKAMRVNLDQVEVH